MLFPAHFEAFGRIIIEAFACKVAVIASNAQGLSEIIEDRKDGFLFLKNDIEGMANYLFRLYHNELLYNEVVNNAYQKFQSNYKLKDMIHKIEKSFKSYLVYNK